jgi:hypothetical protein
MIPKGAPPEYVHLILGRYRLTCQSCGLATATALANHRPEDLFMSDIYFGHLTVTVTVEYGCDERFDWHVTQVKYPDLFP